MPQDEDRMTNGDQLTFVVFLIHALKEAWGVGAPEVYSLLKKSGALDKYIVPFYDVLHTCGKNYLVEDITGYLADRGYAT